MGLCYYCDDKWAPRHKCQTPKLFLLEGLKREGEEEFFKAITKELQMGEVQGATKGGELLGLCLHAISGTPSPQTM